MAEGKLSVGGHSVVDRGTTLKGTLAASSPVLVLGTLDGEVTGPGVEIEAGGKLVGKAKVGQLRCRGELSGEFDADEVELTGLVHEQTVICARTLLVSAEPGRDGKPAVTFGACLIQVGDPPSKEQVISETLAASAAPDPLPAPAPVPAPVIEPQRPASPRPGPVRAELPGRASIKGELSAGKTVPT
jgi:hypothetical protein